MNIKSRGSLFSNAPVKDDRTFWWGVALLGVVTVFAVVGAIMLGHVLETLFRFLVMSEDNMASLPVFVITLVVALIVGSGSLIVAVFLKNNIIRFTVWGMNLIIAPIISVIDIVIRATHIFGDLNIPT